MLVRLHQESRSGPAVTSQPLLVCVAPGVLSSASSCSASKFPRSAKVAVGELELNNEVNLMQWSVEDYENNIHVSVYVPHGQWQQLVDTGKTDRGRFGRIEYN